jgi:hypothetical protein
MIRRDDVNLPAERRPTHRRNAASFWRHGASTCSERYGPRLGDEEGLIFSRADGRAWRRTAGPIAFVMRRPRSQGAAQHLACQRPPQENEPEHDKTADGMLADEMRWRRSCTYPRCRSVSLCSTLGLGLACFLSPRRLLLTYRDRVDGGLGPRALLFRAAHLRNTPFGVRPSTSRGLRLALRSCCRRERTHDAPTMHG